MASFKGFVRSLQVRDDGWVEAVLQGVHAGNATQIFFIQNLDGDINTAHKRLGHLSLLRDAVARVLPVEIEYSGGEQGNIIEDLTIHPRPSIDGRFPGRRIEGVVIGLAIAEFGPVSSASPYTDKPDVANIVLLNDDGSLEQIILDLQRPNPLTAQAMLALFQQAHRTRRPVAVLVSDVFRDPDAGPRPGLLAATAPTGQDIPPGFVQGCEWLQVPEETLNYLYAFIERLGQRYESYEAYEAPALSHVKVVYTTAPGQTPEGDVSDNGLFAPQTMVASIHADSPLLARLETALRDRLQVKLGLLEQLVHEVELVGHLGSAARPIWICVNRKVLPQGPPPVLCDNLPTITTPSGSSFDSIPAKVSWRAEGYFNEGIWRFGIKTAAHSELLIDGKTPCCEQPEGCGESGDARDTFTSSVQSSSTLLFHAYLNGMHTVEVIVCGRTCSKPFQLLAYRIR